MWFSFEMAFEIQNWVADEEEMKESLPLHAFTEGLFGIIKFFPDRNTKAQDPIPG
jgi:hypothetical protein